AEVSLAYSNSGRRRLPGVHIENATIRRYEDRTIVETDAEGRFSLLREPDAEGAHFAVIVVHPDLFAEVDREAFEAEPTITARPWGRIEGVARIGDGPARGMEVGYLGNR